MAGNIPISEIPQAPRGMPVVLDNQRRPNVDFAGVAGNFQRSLLSPDAYQGNQRANAALAGAFQQAAGVLEDFAMRRAEAKNAVDLAQGERRMNEEYAAFQNELPKMPEQEWAGAWQKRLQEIQGEIINDKLAPVTRDRLAVQWEQFAGRSSVSVSTQAVKQELQRGRNIFEALIQSALDRGDTEEAMRHANDGEALLPPGIVETVEIKSKDIRQKMALDSMAEFPGTYIPNLEAAIKDAPSGQPITIDIPVDDKVERVTLTQRDAMLRLDYLQNEERRQVNETFSMVAEAQRRGEGLTETDLAEQFPEFNSVQLEQLAGMNDALQLQAYQSDPDKLASFQKRARELQLAGDRQSEMFKDDWDTLAHEYDTVWKGQGQRVDWAATMLNNTNPYKPESTKKVELDKEIFTTGHDGLMNEMKSFWDSAGAAMKEAYTPAEKAAANAKRREAEDMTALADSIYEQWAKTADPATTTRQDALEAARRSAMQAQSRYFDPVAVEVDNIEETGTSLFETGGSDALMQTIDDYDSLMQEIGYEESQ